MNFEDYNPLIMAERLKQLRKSKGLSHEKLSKAIKEKYEIKISTDSLMNYEYTDEYNKEKCKKNQGMRVEYLRCFADFYGVSSDYILGISDVKTPDVTAQTVIEYTGLSETNVKTLHFMKENAQNSLVIERKGAKIDTDGCIPILDCFNDVFDALVDTKKTAERIVNYYVTIRQETGTLGENKNDQYYLSGGKVVFLGKIHGEKDSNAIVEYMCMKIGREVEKKLKNKYTTHYLTPLDEE